jgi:hypothetical protein
VTPLYPQKLALTSPTGGGRSVGIVRSRTKAMEFSFSFFVRHKNFPLIVLFMNLMQITEKLLISGLLQRNIFRGRMNHILFQDVISAAELM